MVCPCCGYKFPIKRIPLEHCIGTDRIEQIVMLTGLGFIDRRRGIDSLVCGPGYELIGCPKCEGVFTAKATIIWSTKRGMR